MKERKWLSLAEGVVLTPAIIRTLNVLDPFFEGESSLITSGLRTPEKQLQIIAEKALRHSIHHVFPEFKNPKERSVPEKMRIEGLGEVYWWQRTWSKLLSLKDVVNPPLPAEALFDYVRPGSNENKRGQVIDISNHQRGLSFDIGGGSNLKEKANRVAKVLQSGQAFMKGYLMEQVNNAVHVDVLPLNAENRYEFKKLISQTF
jgi:hypothetical protein